MLREERKRLAVRHEASGRRTMAEKVRRWLAKGLLPRGFPDLISKATYVGNNRVLVSTWVGNHILVYYVEADDRLLSPYFIATGRFESNLTNYFLRNLAPDSHCLDIGANFGFYSCLMAKYCPDGRILGVEAERRIADLARDNLFVNDLYGRADILAAAVSDAEGTLTLYRRTSRSGNTSIVPVDEAFTTVLGEPPAQPFTVASTRIDDLAEKFGGRVNFIKVDVEGAEPLVLAGARETIRRNRDIAIVMEWSPGQIAAAGFDVAQFVRDISDQGLRAFTIGPYDERPIADGTLAAMPYQAGILLRHADAR